MKILYLLLFNFFPIQDTMKVHNEISNQYALNSGLYIKSRMSAEVAEALLASTDSLIAVSEKFNYSYGVAVGYAEKSVYESDFKKRLFLLYKSYKLIEGSNAVEDLQLKSFLYSRFGNYLINQRRYEEGKLFINKGLGLASKVNNPHTFRKLNDVLIKALRREKKYSEAVSACNFLYKYSEVSNDLASRFTSLNQLGMIYNKIGKYDSAEMCFLKIINDKENYSHFKLKLAHHNIANSYWNKKDYILARKHFNLAIFYLTEVRDNYSLKKFLITYMDLADMEIGLGNFAVADSYLNMIFSKHASLNYVGIDEDYLHLSWLMKVFRLKEKVLEHKVVSEFERLNAIKNNYALALKILKKARNNFKSYTELKVLDREFNSVVIKLMDLDYRLLIIYKVETQNSLFAYMQKSKFHSFYIRSVYNKSVNNGNLSDSLRYEITKIKNQVKNINNQIVLLRRQGKSQLRDSIDNAIFDKILKQEIFKLKVSTSKETRYKNNYSLIEGYKSVSDIQRINKTNYKTIEYFTTPSHLYTFTITKDTAFVLRSEAISPEEVNSFREAITTTNTQSGGSDSLNYYSSLLYEKLMKKPLDILKQSGKAIKKLYIIPDKHLGFVPFETLLSEPATNFNGNYKDLPYLIKQYDISYGYSASILFRDQLDSTKIDASNLRKPKVLAFAPSFDKLFSDETEQETLGQFRGKLSHLTYNGSEIKGIKKIFDGTFLSDKAATEKAFNKNADKHNIFHFATHGLVDTDKPEYSKLVFTMEKDTLNDNYLHNFELYNMNLDADMVVLSACNTGYGKLEGGEGVMSLGRAFTYAGAKSVVMSHWPADDQSTSSIMALFYKNLADGMTKDAALRKAKLTYLQNASAFKQSPFYWNNFVVMGDVSVLAKPERQRVKWIFLSIFMATIVLGLAVYSWKMSKRKIQL